MKILLSFSESAVRYIGSIEPVEEEWRKLGVTDYWLSEYTNYITVSRIVVPKSKRGSGLGTKAMKILCTYADKMHKPILLSPSTDFGGIMSRLIKFYKNLGFVPNKGQHSVDTGVIKETMIYHPR